MKCADPVLCYTTGKKKYYRHFSLASSIIKQCHQTVFNCGQCIFCRKKRAFELAQRCVLHSSLYKQNCFLTLTYDESKEGYHNEFNYPDIQLFKKRLRQYVARNFGRTIEIFNVHEYGKRGKKHWHLIVFNFDFDDKELHSRRDGIPLYRSGVLSKLWPHGFNTLGDVSAASAMYQAQYVEKDLRNGNRTNSKKAHSKHSGIGKPYFLKHYKQILRLGFIPVDGKRMPIPRYFQKLADRHWCHFYEKSAFFDLSDRKAKYRPFKREEPNKELADLYAEFKNIKAAKIAEMEREWEEVIAQHLSTKEAPEFKRASENYLHDLKNKNVKGAF